MKLSEAWVGKSYTIVKMDIAPLENKITVYASLKVVSKDSNGVVFHCAGSRFSVNMNVASKIWLEKI